MPARKKSKTAKEKIEPVVVASIISEEAIATGDKQQSSLKQKKYILLVIILFILILSIGVYFFVQYQPIQRPLKATMFFC